MDGSLRRLFSPRSVAVVGASERADKAGHQMLKTLLGLPGDLVAVHPKADRILDVPAYRSLTAVPHPVDLAVLVVPPPVVPDVLRDGARAGIGAAVICAGGFAEAGADGARLQDEARAVAVDAGIRLLGPNTSGFANPVDGVHAVFLPPVKELRSGGLAVVAQSGGVNLSLAFLAHREGLGLRLAAGLGNAVDVTAADVLDHLADDDATAVVALHLEGITNGDVLCAAVERVVERKPVIALKVGRSDVGDFARSHTGALTGDWQLARSALAQSGAVVVDTTEELVDAARAFGLARITPSADPGVGVVTGQAGPGLLIADTLRSGGVATPELSEDTTARLAELLPPITFQRNPVDTGRPEPTFPEVLRTVGADPGIDALVVFALQEPGALDLAAAVGPAGSPDRPIIVGTGGIADAVEATRAALEPQGIAVYDTPERAARAMRALVEDARSRWLLRRRSQRDTRAVDGPFGPAALDEDEAKALLDDLGLRAPDRRSCSTRAEAHDALAEIGPPVVVKALHPSVTHKTEVGGVHVGVRSPEELDQALDTIEQIAEGVRFLVEAQAPPGPELIVGATRDASFGPIVLLGIGGVTAEALRLVALRRAPLTHDDARGMLAELPGRELLTGFRGWPAADEDELARIVCAVGDLLEQRPEIAEVDLNPVRITTDGAVVLDALIVLGDDE